jgi:hypothetical protein
MKKKIFWSFFLLSVVLWTACDDDKKPFTDFKKGAIPLFTPKADDSGFVDYGNLDATTLSFTVNKEGLADVQSIDVMVTYNNSQTGKSDQALVTTVTSFPKDVTISKSDLIAAFKSEVLTQDSISIGDSFTVDGYVRLADGTYLTGGYSPSIFSKKPVNLNYNVSCKSELGGTLNYKTSNVTAGAGGVAANCGSSVTGQVDFDAQGGGVYKISDITFGQYDCAWADNPASGVSLVDVCNHLSLTGTDQYGLIYSISIISNDGTTLKIHWENDYGDSGTTELTRMDGTQWPLTLSTD